MSAVEKLRYVLTYGGISAFVIWASPNDNPDIDSIRLGSNNTIGPTPDMVIARVNPDGILAPTPTPIPTIGAGPDATPTPNTNSGPRSGETGTRPPTVARGETPEGGPTPEIIEGLNYQWASEISALTDEFRVKNGLPPYHPDLRLKTAAENYAEFYFKNGDPVNLDHFLCDDNGDCSPWERAAREGYGGILTQVTENMASGYKSASEAFAGWLGSLGHRANLLSSKYQDTGVACWLGIRYLENRPYESSLCLAYFGVIPPDPPPPEPRPTATPTSTTIPESTPTPTPQPTPSLTAEPSPAPTPTP